jgi:hypothetical protein
MKHSLADVVADNLSDNLTGTPTSAGPLPYYEAAAVVGMEIDPQKLVRTERTFTPCEHLNFADAPDNPLLKAAVADEWEHCPWCGKPLYEEKIGTIPEWDSSDPDRPLLAGLSVVATGSPDSPGLVLTDLGRAVIRQGVRLFAGEIVVRTDAGAMARLADVTSEMLSDARARVLKRLHPLGLWDNKKFGVWAVLNTLK